MGLHSEAEIKAGVLQLLRTQARLREDDVLIAEFPVASAAVRADLVVARRNLLSCFEIKTKQDSLVRLESQIRGYLPVFDEVVCVVDTRHVERALSLLPCRVGLWSVDESGIAVIRECAARRPSKVQVCSMLTLSELRKCCRILGQSPSGDRTQITRRLAMNSYVSLRSTALERVRSRYARTSGDFIKKTASDPIMSDHIRLLSPGAATRSRLQTLVRGERDRWAAWSRV